MQARRVILLFALALGVTALVAPASRPPEERGKMREKPGQGESGASASPIERARSRAVTLTARRAGAVRRPGPVPRVRVGTSVSVQVRVAEPGDVLIEGLGLRRFADPRSPARFDLLAEPEGRYDVAFAPIRGRERRVGRLVFSRRADRSRLRR